MAADADALHYNGKNKPWDAPMPRCADVDAEPKTALDIWHQHCGPEFCPCDNDAETDGDGANGEAARRRLEEEGSEPNHLVAFGWETAYDVGNEVNIWYCCTEA